MRDLARNEILRRAHGLIVEHGWGQDDYGDRGTGLCAAAALVLARDEVRLRCRYEHDSESIDSGYRESLAYLQAHAASEGFRDAVSGVGSVVDRNDAPGRTQGEVLDLFSQAFVPGS